MAQRGFGAKRPFVVVLDGRSTTGVTDRSRAVPVEDLPKRVDRPLLRRAVNSDVALWSEAEMIYEQYKPTHRRSASA